MKRLFLIVLLFALILFPGMVLPLKTFASKVSYQYYYDIAEDVVKVEFVDIKDEDQVSCAEVVDAEIGDKFIGLSGKTYILQEQSILSKDQLQYLANQGIVVLGVWVSVDEASDSGGSNGGTSNIEVVPVGGLTQGPFYTTEGGVVYEYYLGYVPPSPDGTPGGRIVTYMEPMSGGESESAEGGEEITVKPIGIVENVIGWVTEWTVGSDTFYTVSPDYGSSMFILIGLPTTTVEPTSTNDLFL